MALKGKYSKVHGTALVPAVATYSEASDQVLQTQLAAKDFAKDRVTCSLLALRMSKDLNGLLHKASSYGAAPCRLRRVCCTKPSLSVDGLLLAGVYNIAQQSASTKPGGRRTNMRCWQ